MAHTDGWCIVRRSRLISGGVRVIRTGIADAEQAARIAASYARPHQAMTMREILDRRLAALDERALLRS